MDTMDLGVLLQIDILYLADVLLDCDERWIERSQEHSENKAVPSMGMFMFHYKEMGVSLSWQFFHLPSVCQQA